MTKRKAFAGERLQIVMPQLHEGQRHVLDDDARFKVLRAGRRWRKTSLGVVQSLTGYGTRWRGALHGGQIGWFAPTYRIALRGWEPIKGLVGQIPGSRIEQANYRAILPTGGSITVVSTDNPDSGRGMGLDGVVVDEAALMSELVWTETIRPALSDRLGWGLFLFTPKGLNWCHALVLDAANREGWNAYHYPSASNPFIDPAEIDAMRSEMSTAVFQQEVMAEFIDTGAGMFDRSWFRYWWPVAGGGSHYQLGQYEQPISADACWKFQTVDLAWTMDERADYTVVSTWAVTPRNHLLLLDRVRGRFEGPQIVRTLRAAYEQWRPGYIVVEAVQEKLGIMRDLEASGLPIRQVRADKSKEARALPATARMEAGQVWFPQGATWLPDWEEEILAFPLGRHDDQVDTLAYAVLEVAANTRSGGAPMVGVTL